MQPNDNTIDVCNDVFIGTVFTNIVYTIGTQVDNIAIDNNDTYFVVVFKNFVCVSFNVTVS